MPLVRIRMPVKIDEGVFMQTMELPRLKTTVRLFSPEPGAPGGDLLGFADVTIADAFVIKGIRILMGKASADRPAGPFISFPARKGTGKLEGQYVDIAHPITTEAYHAVRDSILAAYAKASGGQA